MENAPKISKEQQKILDDLNSERKSVAKKIKTLQNFIFTQELTKQKYNEVRLTEIVSKQVKVLQEYYERLSELIKEVSDCLTYNENLPKNFKSVVTRN